MSANPFRQSSRSGDVVQRQGDGAVKRAVLAVLGIAHWRWSVLTESHQTVAVCIIEGVRRCGPQYRRNTTQGDDLRIMHIDESTDTAAQ